MTVVGDILGGKYRLLRLLGEGGVGQVFEALNQNTDRRVAIKTLHAQWANDSSVVQRFLREARAATRISHPNVVDVLDLDVDQASGLPYIVQEFLAGESLEAHLAARPDQRLSLDETLRILVSVMQALVAAHRLGIVHRDLKPANLLLTVDRAGAPIPTACSRCATASPSSAATCPWCCCASVRRPSRSPSMGAHGPSPATSSPSTQAAICSWPRRRRAPRSSAKCSSAPGGRITWEVELAAEGAATAPVVTVTPITAPLPARVVATPHPAQPVGSAPVTGAAITSRWWFWTGLGAVAAGGTALALGLSGAFATTQAPVGGTAYDVSAIRW